jgi:hypothetical protein
MQLILLLVVTLTKHEEEIATLKEEVHMNNNKISELEQLNILLESD